MQSVIFREDVLTDCGCDYCLMIDEGDRVVFNYATPGITNPTTQVIVYMVEKDGAETQIMPPVYDINGISGYILIEDLKPYWADECKSLKIEFEDICLSPDGIDCFTPDGTDVLTP